MGDNAGVVAPSRRPGLPPEHFWSKSCIMARGYENVQLWVEFRNIIAVHYNTLHTIVPYNKISVTSLRPVITDY